MECGIDKQTKLLEVASAVYSRYRKLMRHQLGQLSHFLQLAEEVNSTFDQLKQAASVSTLHFTDHAATASDSREQLSHITARLKQLVAMQGDLESIVASAEAEVANLKVSFYPCPQCP